MRGRRHQIQAKRVEIEGVYFVLSEHGDVFGIDDSANLLGSSSAQSSSSSSSSLPASSTLSLSSSSSSIQANELSSTSPPPPKRDRMTLYLGEASSSALAPHPTPMKGISQPNFSSPESSSLSTSSSLQSTSSAQSMQNVNRIWSRESARLISTKVLQEQRVRTEVNEIVTTRLQSFYDQGKIADLESFQHLSRHLVNIVANKRIAAKKYDISADGRKRIEGFVDKSMRPNNNDSFVYDYRLYLKKQN